MVIYDHPFEHLWGNVSVVLKKEKIARRLPGLDRKKNLSAYGLMIPSFRIRARNVLRSSPRSSADPFFPLIFH